MEHYIGGVRGKGEGRVCMYVCVCMYVRACVRGEGVMSSISGGAERYIWTGVLYHL